MKNKPMIRHCKNCQYCGSWLTIEDTITCKVKYKRILDNEQRIKALFCRHYKQKVSKEGE